MRRFLTCALVGSLFLLASLTSAQELNQTLTVTNLTQPGSVSTTFSVATSAEADTSHYVSSWPYIGVTFYTTTSGSTVDVWVIAECGNGDNVTRCDSTRIQTEGAQIWMLSIPISAKFRILFEGGSGISGVTTISAVKCNRHW